MKTAFQLLSLVALYSDLGNTFGLFDWGVATMHRAPSGRLRFIATHPLEA